MRLHRNNAKKLASLSALGASALVLTAGNAEAGIIYTVVASNNKVGFDTGYTANYMSPTLPHSAAFKFFTQSLSSVSGEFRRLILGSGVNGLRFAGPSSASATNRLSVFGLGANWNTRGTRSESQATLIGRTWNTSLAGTSGASFTDQYALFRFGPAANPLYGWLQMSATVQAGMGTGPGLGPDLTIEAFAYDDTGAVIAAGDTGGTAPEQSTFALSGLAALVLGAKGLRRWRAARQA